MHQAQRNHMGSFGLSLLGGFVDTLGFVALFGLFTGHITGNFVLIGAELSRATHESIGLKLMAFPAFMAGVSGARLLAASLERRAIASLRYALAAELVLLACFMVCGVLAGPVAGDNVLASAAGLFGACAMGVHSATSRLQLASLPPTSMMTGNVTQLILDVTDLARGAGDDATRVRAIRFARAIAGFACGAVLGAFGYTQLGFAALALPLVILLVLIVLEVRQVPASTANT